MQVHNSTKHATDAESVLDILRREFEMFTLLVDVFALNLLSWSLEPPSICTFDACCLFVSYCETKMSIDPIMISC